MFTSKRHEQKHAEQLDGILTVAGDFKQTDVRTVSPKFHQHAWIAIEEIISQTMCLYVCLSTVRCV